MERIVKYQKTINAIFDEYANYPHTPDGVRYEKIMDTKNNRFQLLRLGWKGVKRVYAIIFHVDIINEKIWIQEDNTEIAIANLLTEKGIQKSEIVLAYFSEQKRKHTEFAVA